MPINKYTPEQQAAIDYFMPYVQQAAKKVADAPNGPYFMTAFIFQDDEENPVLIHVGNVSDRGEELVTLHFQLSCIAASIDDRNAVERSEIKTGPNTQTPEEIADKLAVALLATPLASESDDLKALLNDYLQSRRK